MDAVGNGGERDRLSGLKGAQESGAWKDRGSIGVSILYLNFEDENRCELRLPCIYVMVLHVLFFIYLVLLFSCSIFPAFFFFCYTKKHGGLWCLCMYIVVVWGVVIETLEMGFGLRLS